MNPMLANELETALQLAEGGRPDAALEQLHALTRRHPAEAEPWRLIGVLALQSGDLVAADRALSQAHRLAPRSVAVLSNLGALAASRDDIASAEAHYRDALSVEPRHPGSHNNLAGILFGAGRIAEAQKHYRQALASDPGHVPARSNLSACLLALGHIAEAHSEAERATTDAAGYPPAWLALARARSAQGDHAGARHAFERCIHLGLHSPESWYGIAQALDDLDDWAASLDWCQRLLERVPDHGAAASLAQHLRRRLCRHRDIAAGRHQLQQLLTRGVDGIAPFALLSEELSPEWQLRAAQLASQEVLAILPVSTDVSAGVNPASTNAATAMDASAAESRIRVGFVSNGFGQHPTALLIADLIEQLSDGAMTTIGYATSADDGGPMRRRLREAFAEFRELSPMDWAAAAKRIADDHIDILIDLRGWGGGSAAELFARRPAPIQVNWLAYPGTSGAPWIDAILADRFVIPPEESGNYSEAVIHLPNCFQPSDSTRVIADPPPRPELGLPDEAVVFACFNNSYKYSPETVRRFWRVLHGVAGSVLWLLDGKIAEVRDNLRALARDAGIDPQRLVFLPKQPHERYLACYSHADLFLDSTPYNAHTTASDALWAGCPVLTLPGRSFASRVAGSLNATLGMNDMNAPDEDRFVARAIKIGNNAAQRDELKARLTRARSESPLFDMRRFARDFETALLRLAGRGADGEPRA